MKISTNFIVAGFYLNVKKCTNLEDKSTTKILRTLHNHNYALHNHNYGCGLWSVLQRFFNSCINVCGVMLTCKNEMVEMSVLVLKNFIEPA